MNIRVATVQDLDAVMTLVQSCITHMRTQGIEQWDDLYPDRALFEEDIASGALYLAIDRQICCGLMVLNSHQDPAYATVKWNYRGEPILVVHRLAVGPAHQGQGIASQLMDFAEAHGYTHRVYSIRLDAFSQNPGAVRLYTNRHYHLAGSVTFRKGTFYCFEKLLYQPGSQAVHRL